MKIPEPPVNVRLVTEDDEVIPVQCQFVEYDLNGVALWVVVDAPVDKVYLSAAIETLPALTSVRFPVMGE